MYFALSACSGPDEAPPHPPHPPSFGQERGAIYGLHLLQPPPAHPANKLQHTHGYRSHTTAILFIFRICWFPLLLSVFYSLCMQDGRACHTLKMEAKARMLYLILGRGNSIPLHGVCLPKCSMKSHQFNFAGTAPGCTKHSPSGDASGLMEIGKLAFPTVRRSFLILTTDYLRDGVPSAVQLMKTPSSVGDTPSPT